MKTQTVTTTSTSEVKIFEDFVVFEERLLKRPRRKLTHDLLSKSKHWFDIVSPALLKRYRERGTLENLSGHILDPNSKEATELLEARDYERIVRYNSNTGFLHRPDGSVIPRVLCFNGNIQTGHALEDVGEDCRRGVFERICELIQTDKHVRNFKVHPVFWMNEIQGIPHEFFFSYKLSSEEWEQVWSVCHKKKYFSPHTMVDHIWEQTISKFVDQAIQEFHQKKATR